jgi:hypothetical protein
MLTREEQDTVYAHAYLPEHLPAYLEAVTASAPRLRADHLYLIKGSHLTLIGYPLKGKTDTTPKVYHSLCEDLHPETVALIAPQIWLSPDTYEAQPGDDYYRLELPLGTLPQGVAYMIRRAKRELTVLEGTFGREHKRLIREFLSNHNLTPAQKKIYKAIPRYLKHSSTARLLEARRGDHLAAFNILDLGGADYAFYLFNFRSRKGGVPGASDLLFREMAEMARGEGKGAMNLGLGIHPGIRRFKEKWGGRPFLPHCSGLVRMKSPGLGSLARKL